MATVHAAEVSHAPPPSGADSASTQQEPQTFNTPEFKRNFFLTTPEVGVKPGETAPEKVQFKDRTREQFTTFLDNWVTTNHREYWQPGGRDALKFRPEAQAILKLLGGTAKDLDDATMKDKIRSILDKPQGWALTHALIQEETAIDAMALGLVAASDNADQVVNPQDILDKEAQEVGEESKKKGRIKTTTRRILNKTPLVGWHMRETPKGLAVWSGALAGGIITETADPETLRDIRDFIVNVAPDDAKTYIMAGLMAGGAYAGAKLHERFKRRGKEKAEQATKADPKSLLAPSEPALEAVQNNPELAAYIRRTRGIDVNAFSFDADGRLQVDDPEAITGNVKGVLDRARRNMEAQNMFYKDLGIPPADRRVMPERTLLQGSEMRGTSGDIVSIQTYDKYLELGAAEEDGLTATPEEINRRNAERYRKARELVMADLAEDLISQAEQTPSGDTTTLQTKLDARTQNTGTILQERQQRELKEKSFADAGAGQLQGRLDALEKYKQAQRDLDKARDALPSYLREKFGSRFIDPKNPDKDPEGAAQEAYEAMQDVLYTEGAEITIAGQGKIKSIYDRETKLSTDRRAEEDQVYEDNKQRKGESFEDWQRRIQPFLDRIGQKYAHLAQPIERDKQILVATMGEINTRQTNLQQAEEALAPEGELAQKRNAALAPQTNAELEGQLFAELPPEDLRTKPISELLGIINMKYEEGKKKTPPEEFGWPAEANNQGIDILLHAMVEARQEPRFSDNLRLVRDSRTNDQRAGITEQQIVTMEPSELRDLIEHYEGATLSDDDINQLKNEINTLRNSRDQEIRNLMQELQKTSRLEERKAQSVDLSAETALLQTTIELMGRQGPIFGKTREVLADTSTYFPTHDEAAGVEVATKISDLSDREQRTFTEAERNADVPLAYHQFLNILFDYHDKADREAQFKKYSAVIKPDAIAEAMKHAASPPLEGNTFAEPVVSMNQRDRIVTPLQMRNVFRELTDQLRKESLALS